MRLVWAKAFIPHVFSYDAVCAENRTHHLPKAELIEDIRYWWTVYYHWKVNLILLSKKSNIFSINMYVILKKLILVLTSCLFVNVQYNTPRTINGLKHISSIARLLHNSRYPPVYVGNLLGYVIFSSAFYIDSCFFKESYEPGIILLQKIINEPINLNNIFLFFSISECSRNECSWTSLFFHLNYVMENKKESLLFALII